jgi:putative hydrolase of the HAD superfamily
MIGDDLPVDILGAKQVGMSQIYFNPDKKNHNEKIDYEISSLNQIKDIL